MRAPEQSQRLWAGGGSMRTTVVNESRTLPQTTRETRPCDPRVSWSGVWTVVLCVCVLVHPSLARGQILNVDDTLSDPSTGANLKVTQILNQSAIVTDEISLSATDPGTMFTDPDDPTKTLTIYSVRPNPLTGVVRE